ncbi:MAG TPA: S8 family serine peptidase [Planctomycetota bacterium]|nr:S8 family serine peptidase [Planctomycetota bacterium]HRU52605.1 S8 family serine peptidase [Planctomycetota bacterium]
MKISQILLILTCALLLSCQSKKVLETPPVNLDPLPTKIEHTEGEDPGYEQQWNLIAIDAPATWEKYPTSSKAVKVMLIGTGIDYNHEDLRANVYVNHQELQQVNTNKGTPFNKIDDDNDGLVDNIVGWDYVDNDGLAYDKYGYDTYLAGVIGAVHGNGKGIKGIMKKITLYPVRYIDANGQSNIPTLFRALNHVLDVRPDIVHLNLISLKLSRNIDVQNIEIYSIHSVLNKIEKLGIPIIIGAGNIQTEFGIDVIDKIFTSYDNILIVTSIDKENTKPDLANYSPRYVHTTAPGQSIYTTAPHNQYKIVSSTYLAAAHVTAAIAYAISEYGTEKNYKDYFQALQNDDASTPLPKLKHYVAGRNTLNLLKFLDYLK